MDRFNYLNPNNLQFLEEQYQMFQEAPGELNSEWRMFFEGMEYANKAEKPDSSNQLSSKELHVYNLIHFYRDYGHLKANVDPLNLKKTEDERFALKNFELEEKDLNSIFNVGSLLGLKNSKLQDIISELEKTYCQTLTVDASGCEPSTRNWLHKEFEEKQKSFKLTKNQKIKIFKSLARTESLEKFIHTRFVGTKRFSVEGGDALIPMLETAVEVGTALNIEEFVIGMAHRGRINVLANFMDKGLDLIFADFDGKVIDNTGYDGDVKYHMGYSSDKKTDNGNCHISLAYNPSHLEAVGPVVCGMTRAKQRKRNNTEVRDKVVPIIIHGDAAVIGQGVVSETLQLSKLKGYTVGGSLHIIINNQVGFTTNPESSRSTRYSSDIAKAIKAPTLIVNGDDVEACVAAIDMALRYRQEFKEDIFIDMICYRRFGHNEGDEPAFTQPKMYSIIKKHPTLLKLYSDTVVNEGLMSTDETKNYIKEKMDNLQKELEDARENPPELHTDSFKGLWEGLRRGTLNDFDTPADTSVKITELKKVALKLTTDPENFNTHRKIKKLIDNRAKMVADNKLDWGMTELLAYASLRNEGTSIRLSGQDCKRGTFSHRHSVYFDSENGSEHCPIKTINPDNGEFCVYNSSLSEMAVLGFEYGNASSDPTFLTIWEAQFGDFANGAQIIIDQFLASGEEKWARMSGLTLLLPHGYEGQGPEHSSARLERFLQLCGQANMQVCNFTTPANLFHALRRQVSRNFRKPLVVMTPKSLLRHPKVFSTFEELGAGQFQEVIADPNITKPEDVENVILCSGKVYYDLEKAFSEKDQKNKKTAIIRMEQMYPFPKSFLAPHLNGYPNLQKIFWVQEEPKNMGAYNFIAPFIQDLIDELGLNKRVLYIGRPFKASPATGSPKIHANEQQAIIDACLSL